MALLFNIIYTPGTVQQLSFLVYSLLRWSDCRFRLVANGCGPAEVRQLQAFTQGQPALELLVLPTKRPMAHGQALNYLQALTHDDYFCFMDSDIYAQGEFLSALLPLLQEYTGIFSGAPLKCRPDERVLPPQRRTINGWHNQTASGLCLGSSYFALYHNPTLSQLIQSSGIGFDAYRWAELPAPYQQALQQIDAQYDGYDTGKVLNLLLHLRGTKLIYQELEALRHIGGISRSHVARQRKSWLQRARLGVNRLRGQTTEQLWGKQLRKETEDYFSEMLFALRNQYPLPKLPVVDDETIAARLQQMSHEVTALYREYGR